MANGSTASKNRMQKMVTKVNTGGEDRELYGKKGDSRATGFEARTGEPRKEAWSYKGRYGEGSRTLKANKKTTKSKAVHTDPDTGKSTMTKTKENKSGLDKGKTKNISKGRAERFHKKAQRKISRYGEEFYPR